MSEENGVTQPPAAEEGSSKRDVPEKFMFDKLHQVMRRRMPTLELIHERFVRTVRLMLFNMIRCPVEVKGHLPEVKSYDEFVKSFPERTNINIVNIRPLRGVGCWIVAPQVVYIAIDNMFGGEGRLAPRLTTKDYTATELRIIRRLMDGILNDYEKAWKPVHEIKFDFMRQETNFQFAKITGPEEMVLHCKFTVDINGREGDIDLCIPYWVLEPVKSQLFNNMQSFQMETDTHWSQLLEKEVQSATVQAVAVLAKKQMTIGEVLSLSVGEIVPIEVFEPITVYVDGLPMIRGRYGVRNGRYAVKIEHIKHPTEFMKSPFERGKLGPGDGSGTAGSDAMSNVRLEDAPSELPLDLSRFNKGKPA